MKRLLPLALLLAACAPTLMAPTPQPGEVVLAVNRPANDNLSVEERTGVVAFAAISTLIVIQRSYDTGLPANYSDFDFPASEKSIQFLGGQSKGTPLHGTQDWQARQKDGPGVVNVHWESLVPKGQFVSIRVQATSTDPTVNTRQVEDALLNRLYKLDGISFVASGR